MKYIFRTTNAIQFTTQLIIILFLSIFFSNQINKIQAAQCNFKPQISVEHQEASTFLKNSLYAIHLQLTNENFSSKQANITRAKMFDTVLNGSFWSQRINSKTEFSIFWNWIRFQFWGLIQQQGLVREDQGFKITNDTALKQAFQKVLKFPLYPYPISSKNYNCSGNESVSYNCINKMVQFDVVLSPSLACTSKTNLENLTFAYILTQENSGWLILDIKFKGKSLISESFIEYDNLLNKYGSEKALNYLKIHLNKAYLVEPEIKVENIGSTAFNKNFKIQAPAYPLNY